MHEAPRERGRPFPETAMTDSTDRRPRHPVVLLFVGVLLVCDVIAGRILRRRHAHAMRLLDSSR